VSQAAELLVAVVGQDFEKGDTGGFRIARRVAPDRIISTGDPEARHGHKTSARGFDGYKGHIAIDPDAEIITSMKVTAGNVGDGAVPPSSCTTASCRPTELRGRALCVPEQAEPSRCMETAPTAPVPCSARLDRAGAVAMVKVQPRARRRAGSPRTGSSSTSLVRTVTCPNGVTVPYRVKANGGGVAHFRTACSACPL
jgi:hypothetical protein